VAVDFKDLNTLLITYQYEFMESDDWIVWEEDGIEYSYRSESSRHYEPTLRRVKDDTKIRRLRTPRGVDAESTEESVEEDRFLRL